MSTILKKKTDFFIISNVCSLIQLKILIFRPANFSESFRIYLILPII